MSLLTTSWNMLNFFLHTSFTPHWFCSSTYLFLFFLLMCMCIRSKSKAVQALLYLLLFTLVIRHKQTTNKTLEV